MLQCPLKFSALIGDHDNWSRIREGDGDCIQSSCGWWNQDAHNCGIAIQTIIRFEHIKDTSTELN